jgi:hypothetical protein
MIAKYYVHLMYTDCLLFCMDAEDRLAGIIVAAEDAGTHLAIAPIPKSKSLALGRA